MGAYDFTNCIAITDVQKAFDHAHSEAQHESGHGGYTGTIAEKSGYRVLSREPLERGEELSAFINTHMEDNDKWGPAFAVPLATVTKHKTTTKVVTVKATSREEATKLAMAKTRKSRKGEVRLQVTGVEQSTSDSTDSNKVRKKRLLKQTPKVRYKSGPQRFTSLPAAMKHATSRAQRAIDKGEVRFNHSFTVTPVLVVAVDGEEIEVGHGKAAGCVTIGRNDVKVPWEVTLEITPIKVTRTISGWCFFGYASS